MLCYLGTGARSQDLKGGTVQHWKALRQDAMGWAITPVGIGDVPVPTLTAAYALTFTADSIARLSIVVSYQEVRAAL